MKRGESGINRYPWNAGLPGRAGAPALPALTGVALWEPCIHAMDGSPPVSGIAGYLWTAKPPLEYHDRSRYRSDGHGEPDEARAPSSSFSLKKGSDHLSLDDRDILERPISTSPARRPDFADRIDNVHPLDHFPEDRVLCVQVIVVDEVDEELGSASVGTGICHGHGPAVVPVPRLELVRYHISRSAAPGPGGVSSLDHEFVNHAVEYHPVIVPGLYEGLEVPGRYRHGGIKGDHDRPHVRLKLYFFP